MTIDEILSMGLPLAGVIIGGLITFFIQQSTIKRQHEWEREKIKMDNLNKDESNKFQIYNQILLRNTKYAILEVDMNYGPELHQSLYNNNIKPLLYDIFHLLSDEMANEIHSIEELIHRQFVTEEEHEGDKERLSGSYLKIIDLILKEFKDHRESNKILKSA